MSLIKTLFSAATGALGGIQTYLIAGGLALALGFAGGAYSGYRWETGVVANLKLADEKAKDAAATDAFKRGQKLAVANSKNGANDMTIQTKIVDHYITLTRKVPIYVTPTQDAAAGCISYGFIRVLVASQRDVEPETLTLPAGITDDACTGYTLSTLAAALRAGFLAANQNAQQLNDLIASVRENDSIGAE